MGEVSARTERGLKQKATPQQKILYIVKHKSYGGFMKILSLDSTAIVSTVAICENERLLAQFTINNGNTHSEPLLQ